jgi:hypothetical protein
MPHRILNEDWSDYDNRKIRDNRDKSKFSCEESWEVDYLVRKTQKHFPLKTEAQIRTAITSCCLTVKAPRPREEFVKCVAGKLA